MRNIRPELEESKGEGLGHERKLMKRNRIQIAQKSLTQQEYEELHIEDQNFRASSTNKKGFSQSKVCFGVFASLSHHLLLSEQSAQQKDLAANLQSAFRVLSLTRPELPLITAMFLKTQNFSYAQEISELIHEALYRFVDDYLIS